MTGVFYVSRFRQNISVLPANMPTLRHSTQGFWRTDTDLGTKLSTPLDELFHTSIKLKKKKKLFTTVFCPNGIYPIENLGCFPRGKLAAAESRYPTYSACWAFLCFHNLPNSDMDYEVFNVYTDMYACDSSRGCTDTRKRVCTKVDSGRKISCRTGESNLRRQRAGPMLYQLSYTPHSRWLVI